MAKKSLKEKLDGINEYEREPVPENKVKGFKSFVGMVAGEHLFSGCKFFQFFSCHVTSTLAF